MYVCMYVCCMYVYFNEWMSVRVLVRLGFDGLINCMYVYMYECMYVCTCVFVCMYFMYSMYLCPCMYACIYVCMDDLSAPRAVCERRHARPPRRPHSVIRTILFKSCMYVCMYV